MEEGAGKTWRYGVTWRNGVWVRVRACARVHAALKHISNPGISELSESAAARWDGAGFTKRDHEES